MAYPTLPNNLLSSTADSSESASSVDPEPLTPELPAGESTLTIRINTKGDNSPEQLLCKWTGCDYVSETPDELYDHLCQVHVGRKSTNNLCLTCGWEGCGVKCVKRDHITSHIRVHIPLKPHPCSICGKTFKRPQDLKKHERIHTQEHHQFHKFSKASTTNDSSFNSRHPSSNKVQERPRSPFSNSLSPQSNSSQDVNSSSPYDHLLAPGVHTDKSVSPTPSALAALHKKQHEELAAYQQKEMLVLQQLAFNQQQSQVYAAKLASEPFGEAKSGMKRGQDDTLGGFWEDMKKRKVDPVYDQDMIQRLNALVPPAIPSTLPPIPSFAGFSNLTPNGFPQFGYPGFGSLHNNVYPTTANMAQSSFNGLPIPEIKTEADLEMFNNFMISLGRDTVGMGGHRPQPMSQSGSGSGASSSHAHSGSGSLSPLLDQSNGVEDLFNAEELASLGLAGMPGIPVASKGNTPDNHLSRSLSDHPPTNISLGSLYPNLEGIRSKTNSAPEIPTINDPSKRPIANLPRVGVNSVSYQGQSQKANQYPNLYGLESTPYAEPSHGLINSLSSSDFTSSQSQQPNSNYANFDTLARSKQTFHSVTLAPKDFYRKTFHHVAPLGTSIANRAKESAERTSMFDEDSGGSESTSLECTPKIPVASLIIRSASGDMLPESPVGLKLPAISPSHVDEQGTDLPSIYSIGQHRTSSSISGSGSVSSDHSSSGASDIATPRATSPRRGIPTKRPTEDEIVRGVKRLELGSGEALERDDEGASLAIEKTESDLFSAKLRKKHVMLIRLWIMAVNFEFGRKRIAESLDEGQNMANEASVRLVV
nr:hypothetical protein L204_05970 [Cryptococcus depauperatus CBS 7855]